ncbi:MAG: hypothetical protein NUV82_03750 [Candidatus Komeilibacteria bacterium]|nr:hypothetical protein [Candidatus Komeilibacteria bacterium]
MRNNNLHIWKILANFWSLFTLVFFWLAFMNPGNFDNVLSSISIIYAAILALYVGTKEFSRWKNPGFSSRYLGEVFVVIWTLVMMIFIIITAINPTHSLPSEFAATYITVMGIFAISQKSKTLKSKG